MFTEKTIKQAWSLYQASLKQRFTDQQNIDKHNEEVDEWHSTFYMVGSGRVECPDTTKFIEEFTDKTIMDLRVMCIALKPKSYEEFKLYCDNMSEWMEHKTERTLKRFEEGFYNE